MAPIELTHEGGDRFEKIGAAGIYEISTDKVRKEWS